LNLFLSFLRSISSFFSSLLLQEIFLNIRWPMPLFLDIYFIYRYIMEVDEEQIYVCNSIGVCLWFVGWM
jgi:hypothetical protein